ncbi:MAG: bifunctional hydroxymethylpyrimidine kinase/phosphomethylpyrimidine kinase [Oscillospiraceae bacterium]|nr:bifunctional hydroxymethylpyrimidine kinase/phosphomethylpyrimidine kinase [Oscillospiraceae bacterium]
MNDIKKILTCAGSDPCGGAGIQADIKTISSFGHFAMSAITAVTAQNTMGVSMTEAVSPEMMKSQLDSVFSDIFPDSVKIGMLMNGKNVDIIADRLEHYNAKNIVCDTVIMSTSGRQLLDDEGLEIFIKKLMPIADVITPNIPEAERLCGMKINSPRDMEKAARLLSGNTRGGVLIKGGHLMGEALDILFDNGSLYYFSSPRIDNPNTHGTGCTLSSAIACGLAEGHSLPEAVDEAKKYITRIISAGLDIGHGNGPMWHFAQ